MKRIIVLVLCLAMLVMGVACTKGGSGTGSDTANNADATPTPKPVTIKGTLVFANYGRVDFELYPQFAPESVYNFIYLANNDYFDGCMINRYQKKFCFELGKFDTKMRPKEVPGGEYGIKGEFSSNNVVNELGFGDGTLVWARDIDNPDSACNSFMIMLDAMSAQALSGDYAPFGKITKDGFKVIKKIAKMDVDGETPMKVVELINVEIMSTTNWPEPQFIRPSSDKAD